MGKNLGSNYFHPEPCCVSSQREGKNIVHLDENVCGLLELFLSFEKGLIWL